MLGSLPDVAVHGAGRSRAGTDDGISVSVLSPKHIHATAVTRQFPFDEAAGELTAAAPRSVAAAWQRRAKESSRRFE